MLLSITEIHTQKNLNRIASIEVFSGATGNRTRDTRIFSPLLYQLSYGTRICVSNVLFSFGIAKVDIFSLPANFSFTFFPFSAKKEFLWAEIDIFRIFAVL